MSAEPVTLRAAMPDLASSLGRSLCEATGHDVRAVTIAIDADSEGAPDIVLAVHNLQPSTLLLLIGVVQAMLLRGQAEVVVRSDGEVIARYEGKPS